jgi:hypothetical protein
MIAVGFSALTAGNVLSEDLLDDRMTVLMVLFAIIAIVIAALASGLGADTRRPAPPPRRRRLTRSKPWEAFGSVPDDRPVRDRPPVHRVR